MNFREHQISAGDGLALYVRDYGPKNASSYASNTVICLGGLTRNSKDFHTLADSLSNEYRVLVPDYRGRGRSAYDPDWHHYHPRTYVDDIRHMTVALNIHEFAVVGTSLGGILGMILGVAMPTSLRGVLMNDVSPEIPTDGLDAILAYMRNTAPLPHWDAAVSYLKQTFPDFPAETPDDWLRIAQATYRENDGGQLVYDWDPAIVRGFEEQDASTIDLWPYFRSLRRVPVLSVRGALSPFVKDDTWRNMRNLCPGLVTVTVPNVGHAPSLSEENVMPVMNSWLDRCFA